MSKKTIAIIAPNVVPLPIKETAPKYISINDVSFPLKTHCAAFSVEGNRAITLAKHFAKYQAYDVVLFVPDIYFPGTENIDFTDFNITVKKYNYKSTLHSWSEELDRKLKQCHFVFVQTKSTAAWCNCAVLPKSVHVIVDGYESPLVSTPATLLNQHKIKRAQIWKTLLANYNDLLLRANCILYDNERQKNLYEGHFLAIGKLSWRAFKFSPLLQIPYNFTGSEKSRNRTTTNTIKFLFNDLLYPWYNYQKLFEFFSTLPNIELDILGYPPNYFRVDNECVEQYINNTVNIRFVPSCETVDYNNYDAAISFSHNWLDEYYTPRYNALAAVAKGLPTIINDTTAILSDLPERSQMLIPIHAVEDIGALRVEDFYRTSNADTENKTDIIYRHRDDNVFYNLNSYISIFSEGAATVDE